MGGEGRVVGEGCRRGGSWEREGCGRVVKERKRWKMRVQREGCGKGEAVEEKLWNGRVVEGVRLWNREGCRRRKVMKGSRAVERVGLWKGRV